MKKRSKKFWLILASVLLAVLACYQFFREVYVEDNKRIRTSLRETVMERYPEAAEELRARYGIRPAAQTQYAKSGKSGVADVILVHGLDEPGKVWMNLTPVLAEGGFRAWNFFYPNDQPIAESGRLFFEEMAVLRKEGHEAVSIVAFSMGGLVAREMLTNPELAYSQSALAEKVPKVAQLIMVGTPNHGSELARFRIFMEFRDQLANLSTGNYSWLNGILDGAGEAGLDLIPGSAFLRALNDRPNPDGVRMAVIAGVMSSTDAGDFEKMADKLKRTLPESAHGSIVQMENILNSVANGLGDGIVPVQSARLDGIPLHVVSGTHMSIIRNVTESSPRIPPAVPIIINCLNAPLGIGSQ
jgi:pimeloyl-ACP methyl ester carboxylesterase